AAQHVAAAQVTTATREDAAHPRAADIVIGDDHCTIPEKYVPRSVPTACMSKAISPSVRTVPRPRQGIGICDTRTPMLFMFVKPDQAKTYPADGTMMPGSGATWQSSAFLPAMK